MKTIKWHCSRPNNCLEKCKTSWPEIPTHCFYDKTLKNILWIKVKVEKKQAIVIK